MDGQARHFPFKKFFPKRKRRESRGRDRERRKVKIKLATTLSLEFIAKTLRGLTTSSMEKREEFGAFPFGTRQADLKKSFKLAMRSLLTSCSKQDICKAFPSFTSSEQEHLHQLFIQVASSLHGNIEEEFESVCLETQAGTALDTVEQLVEEQALDPLLSDKTNVADVAENVLTTKENEIQHLKNMLQRVEEKNQRIRARIEVLKKREVDVSVMADALEKLRRGSVNYGLRGSNMIQ